MSISRQTDFIVANLRAYLAFVAEAAAAGVDVLVFPEGTLG
jgi:predicted amidohydrolase